jgi:hypothetical protein
MTDPRVELLRLLTTRLERLSVDSIWARRASGLRGSLVKAIENADAGKPSTSEHLDMLIDRSFEILRNAAREIPDAEAKWRNLNPGKIDHGQ